MVDENNTIAQNCSYSSSWTFELTTAEMQLMRALNDNSCWLDLAGGWNNIWELKIMISLYLN
jgi:hypothetical protein